MPPPTQALATVVVLACRVHGPGRPLAHDDAIGIFESARSSLLVCFFGIRVCWVSVFGDCGQGALYRQTPLAATTQNATEASRADASPAAPAAHISPHSNRPCFCRNGGCWVPAPASRSLLLASGTSAAAAFAVRNVYSKRTHKSLFCPSTPARCTLPQQSHASPKTRTSVARRAS